MQYAYTFTVWPDETMPYHDLTFEVFRMLKMRVEYVATEADFATLRGQLARDGFTLREIERVPYCEPESVL